MGYKGINLELKQVASELGVRYVVQGSLRAAGKRMRISAQLIDAHTDRHIWAEHYDGDMQDVFSVQDAITERIVAAIAPEYVSAEIYRVQRKQDRNFSAWDLFMRAFWHISGFTKEDMVECRRLCREAIKLDPKGAGHYGLIAVSHTIDAIYDWGQSTEQSLQNGLEAALQAVGFDSRDPLAHRALALVHFWYKHHDDAILCIRQSIELDPYEAENYSMLGHFLGMAGDYERAREGFDKAIELSPRDTFLAPWYSNLAMVATVARHHEEAVEWAKASIRVNPNFPGSYRSLAAAYGHLGQLDEAAKAREMLSELLPGLTISRLRERLPVRHGRDLEHYLDGLRRAGLPE